MLEPRIQVDQPCVYSSVFYSDLCTSSKKKWIKTRMKTPVGLNSKGNKSLSNVCLVYDHVFFGVTIIVTCVLIVDVCHIISMWIRSRMTSIKIWKLFWVIKICIPRWVWQKKIWETSFWTCVSFSKTIVTIIYWNASRVVICSFLQGYQSKWVHRWLMIWSHWHCERWAGVGCGIPKKVCNVTKKMS
jgi:hypothetical protein